ncbi:MAG: FAD-dependent monooxygenase, partial [Clostridia bacterium]|nr:FAD-dependent monooxygenase [Clostridia bacterium]
MERVTVKLSLEEDERLLKEKALKAAHLRSGKAKYFKIVRKSLDAREKGNAKWVYTVDILDREEIKPAEFLRADKKARVLVVGSGPAGLFSALYLARGGMCVTLVERGKSVEERAKDVENFFRGGALNESCNVQFGEGGAGT